MVSKFTNFLGINLTRVTHDLYVVVHARVGKEFPDMKQNEKEVKFIRVRDADRTVGQLEGELMLSRGP